MPEIRNPDLRSRGVGRGLYSVTQGKILFWLALTLIFVTYEFFSAKPAPRTVAPNQKLQPNAPGARLPHEPLP